MGDMWLVLAAAVVTYLTRIAGFSIGKRPIPAGVDRFLGYVPVAAFAALITPTLEVGGMDVVPQLIGLALAGLVVLRWDALWAGLAAGMAGFWLASFLLTGGIA